MDIQQILTSLLSLKGETETVEFKEANNQFNFEKIGKYFSALSNEANLQGLADAWLVFGVNDKHIVVGTLFRTDNNNLNALKAEIANKTTNRITFKNIHEVIYEQKRVLLFQIPAAPKGLPIAWQGHYYGRDGEQLNALNLEEIERIRQQGVMQDWSAVICYDAKIDDLSSDAINKARSLYAVKNPKLRDEMEYWDDVTFLNKAKVCINGKITRTAIILLGKELSTHFISPATPTVTWILKDRDGIEKDYEHFSCPLLLNIDSIFLKIRNLKYRYLLEKSIFPDEVDQYDPYIIREALNNCIAHQDYSLGGKITVVENEDSRLSFSNMGSFIPGTLEKVISEDAPESRYRNNFLATAMVNLNMIDTIGSGIRKMFYIQKNKFFPLPAYDLRNNKVKVTITGKVLDVNYAQKLAKMPNLRLDEIIALDKVQKRLPLRENEAKHLKRLKLIEGRKPNYHISALIAKHSGQKAEYIKNKGFDDDFYKKTICDYLKQFGSAKRAELEQLLLDKLPDVLDEQQKSNKVKNLLQSLRKTEVIRLDGKSWRMSKA